MDDRAWQDNRARHEDEKTSHSWMTVVALALGVLALLAGVWAWSAQGWTAAPAGTARAIVITEVNDPSGPGETARVASGRFVTEAKTWAVYWSYYCLMPGVRRWQMSVRLVPLAKLGGKSRVLDAARSPDGPVSYTEIYRIHRPGSYRFVVTATRGCVWSLRAPPVAGGASLALGTGEEQGGVK